MSPYPIPFPRSPFEVNDLFARQRFADPIGHNIHTALAAAACLCAGLPTFIYEWAGLPLLICFFIRMTAHHRVCRPVWCDVVALLSVAWAALLSLSLLWSPATGRALLSDWQAIRYIGFVLAIWPVLDRRNVLICALIIGLLIGQASQALQYLQDTLHFRLLPLDRMPGRISGWWDPVVAGSLLCAALGLHLAPAVRVAQASLGGRLYSRDSGPRHAFKFRAFALLGALISLTGILATGTRGAWIGAAMLLCIAFVLAAFHASSRARSVRPAIALAIVAVVALGSVALFAGQGLRDRYHRGVSEVHAALTEQNYTSDTGLRIAMWRWAIAAARTHPITGLGSGGYQPWVRAQTPETAADLSAPAQAIPLVHAHAHSWYLHTLTVTGIVGCAILFSMTFLAIRAGLRGPRAFARSSGYAAGPALALIGLACAGLFDPITVNAQTNYLFWLLIALCLPMRPLPLPFWSERGGRAA